MDIKEFYSKHAELYNIISIDRDFNSQVDVISKLIKLASKNSCPKILELFAGPAYHSAIFHNSYNAKTICIDSSVEMRMIATKERRIDQQSYIVGMLPEAISQLDPGLKFDAVTILRYSIGYLKPSQVNQLLKNIYPFLEKDGVIIFELHDLKMVLSNFSQLQIREREVTDSSGEKLRCVWPNGDLKWDENDWVVDMPVLIEKGNSNGKPVKFEFISRERIYSYEELKQISLNTGFYKIEEPSRDAINAFPGAKILVLRSAFV